MPNCPPAALPLLRQTYAVCHTESFAAFIERYARGGLVAVRSGRDVLLVPTEVWERAREDVAGIVREIAAKVE